MMSSSVCLCPFLVELNESYDEDVNSNMFSSSPTTLHERIQQELEIQHHASLKRKKQDKGDTVHGSPVIDKSYNTLSATDLVQQRPASMVVPHQMDSNVSMSPSIGSLNRQVFSV